MDRIGFLICVFIAATAPRTAHAYLDPGTGSMILQLVVAGVLGALFTIKTWWRQICGFVKGLFGRDS